MLKSSKSLSNISMLPGSAAEQSGSNVQQVIAKLRQAPDPVVTRSSGSHGRIASWSVRHLSKFQERNGSRSWRCARQAVLDIAKKAKLSHFEHPISDHLGNVGRVRKAEETCDEDEHPKAGRRLLRSGARYSAQRGRGSRPFEHFPSPRGNLRIRRLGRPSDCESETSWPSRP